MPGPQSSYAQQPGQQNQTQARGWGGQQPAPGTDPSQQVWHSSPTEGVRPNQPDQIWRSSPTEGVPQEATITSNDPPSPQGQQPAPPPPGFPDPFAATGGGDWNGQGWTPKSMGAGDQVITNRDPNPQPAQPSQPSQPGQAPYAPGQSAFTPYQTYAPGPPQAAPQVAPQTPQYQTYNYNQPGTPSYQAGQVSQFGGQSGDVSALQGLASKLAQGGPQSVAQFQGADAGGLNSGAGNAINTALANATPDVRGQQEAAKTGVLEGQKQIQDQLRASAAARGLTNSGAELGAEANLGAQSVGQITDQNRQIAAAGQQQGFNNLLSGAGAAAGLGANLTNEAQGNYASTLAGEGANAGLLAQKFGQLTGLAGQESGQGIANYGATVQGQTLQEQLRQAAAASGQQGSQLGLGWQQAQAGQNQNAFTNALAAAGLNLTGQTTNANLNLQNRGQNLADFLGTSGQNIQGANQNLAQWVAQQSAGNASRGLDIQSQLGQGSLDLQSKLGQGSLGLQQLLGLGQQGLTQQQINNQNRQFGAQLAQNQNQFGQNLDANQTDAFYNTILGLLSRQG